MSRRRPAEESLLFDLPLEHPPGDPALSAETEQPPLPLLEEAVAETPAPAEPLPEEELDSRRQERPPPASAPAGRRRPAAVPLRRRLAAGLTDLAVCAAVMVALLVALLAQGVRPAAADWPAGAVFLIAFSFLYAVLPLAFWGRTPGMALAGLRATGSDDGPLTFRQAALKWLGLTLTVALAGLPLLLALGGRSLSDLLSGSATRRIDLPD